MIMITRIRAAQPAMLALLLLAGSLAGCQQRQSVAPVPPPAEMQPQYARPLPEGEYALRKLTDPAAMPDLAALVSQVRDAGFQAAARKSLAWFAAPSSNQYFPMAGITHAQARASVQRLVDLADLPEPQVRDALASEFDVYQSVGWDGSGAVLYTGYYAPVFRASKRPTSEYRYPLYSRPVDLITDPVSGEVKGRHTTVGVVPYPTRRMIEENGILRGHEMVYLADPFDAYLVHVNGSAKLLMADGSVMFIGYAGSNGRAYTSIGKVLAAEGKIDPNRVSLASIRAYFKENPDQVSRYTQLNDRFVFFQPYEGAAWPAGSLGFPVTAGRSLATDKSIFPRACPVLVDAPGIRGGARLMLDQDTGGAIRAAGRADVFFGIGDHAEQQAGAFVREGRLYYLIVKPGLQ